MWYKWTKNDLTEWLVRRAKYKEGGIVPRVKDYKILDGRVISLKADKNESGSKYRRTIIVKEPGYSEGINFGKVDVYAVLEAFNVTCPALSHAIKKLLCPGARGGKDKLQDIGEAKDAIIRAYEMERARIKWL